MKIKFLDGINRGKEVEFTSPCITIGRDGGNQLVLDTDGVSRCHAELRQNADGSWEICDLNSTNGVKINGKRINTSAPVSEGVTLSIGENTLLLSSLNLEPSRVIFNPIISTPAPSEKELPPVVIAPAPEKNAEEKNAAAKNEVPPKAAEKNLEQFSADLKNFSGSLFGKKESKEKEKKTASSSGFSEPAGKGETESRKRRSNLIFYTTVVCVVVMVLSFAFSITAPKQKKSLRTGELPLALRYEKEIISRSNVFRFDFHLKSSIVTAAPAGKDKNGKPLPPERRREYTVTFTIDDIASKRHFSRETPVSEETVNQLRSAIRNSGIFNTAKSAVIRDNENNRTLTIVDGKRIFRTDVAGKYASTEFNSVEDAVIELTESFGLKTIALTPEQLISQAKSNFLNAEDLFANRRAGSRNLRDAIKRYQVVVEALEQFSPKPPMWDRARVKLAEAIKERDLALAAWETEYKKHAQLRDFAALRNVFREMMELTDPESREHARAKRRLIYIEQLLRKKKR